MLSNKMLEALNSQINAEYYSSYLYLSMAAYCDSINLKGFSHWFKIQAQEEMLHVMKFFSYILDRRGAIQLKAIEGPPVSWQSPTAVFEASFAHEQHVSALINKLADLAVQEHDHASHALLEWFVNEQVEEEANADAILQQLKLIGNAPAALYLLDRELGQRTLTATADAGAE